MGRTRAAAAFALALSVVSAGGCRSFVVDVLAKTPNHDKPVDARLSAGACVHTLLGVDRELFVEVDGGGADPAVIRAWVINPDPDDFAEPRGTVLVLHGIKVPSWVMLVKGRDLTGAGYRVAMVDLRGHGGSTGRWHTYGLREGGDVVAVIDAMEREGLVVGRLGIWGVSYGAATAIRAASIDRRVEAVVAVTPFSTLRGAAQSFIRHHVPFDSRWSDEQLDAMIDEAAAMAGFEADDADTRLAMPHVRAPVLIVGGQTDLTTPVDHALQLFDAAPPGSRLIVFRNLGHTGTGFDPGWRVKRASITWFDRHLAGAGLSR